MSHRDFICCSPIHKYQPTLHGVSLNIIRRTIHSMSPAQSTDITVSLSESHPVVARCIAYPRRTSEIVYVQISTLLLLCISYEKRTVTVNVNSKMTSTHHSVRSHLIKSSENRHDDAIKEMSLISMSYPTYFSQ